MITPRRFTGLQPLSVLVSAFAVLAATACEKVPLVAPSGSTITLTASTNVLPANGSTDIIAQVLEPAGTPPHSGTHVIFTTTLGVIEPSEALTDVNGRVIVKFLANGANGNATITASSGGANTGANGAVKIALGTAAVGRISLTANPSTISANGGASTLTANVVDINGNFLSGVPVSFATTAGALASSLVTTNASGNAVTTLTTAVEAKVTATAGLTTSSGSSGSTTTQITAEVTVKVNPLPTVSITAPGGTLQAGSPITFQLSVSPGSGGTAQIREVIINFGDGDVVNLGGITGTSLPIQHKYDDEGTFTVRATATDTLGGTNSAVAVVVIQPLPPTSVSISKSTTPSGPNTIYTLTATVTPPSVTVANYSWTDETGSLLQSGGSNQLIKTYPTGAVHTITVTATTTNGVPASSSIVLP